MKEHGNNWSLIAKMMTNRNRNQVKNRFHSKQNRKTKLQNREEKEIHDLANKYQAQQQVTSASSLDDKDFAHDKVEVKSGHSSNGDLLVNCMTEKSDCVSNQPKKSTSGPSDTKSNSSFWRENSVKNGATSLGGAVSCSRELDVKNPLSIEDGCSSRRNNSS